MGAGVKSGMAGKAETKGRGENEIGGKRQEDEDHEKKEKTKRGGTSNREAPRCAGGQRELRYCLLYVLAALGPHSLPLDDGLRDTALQRLLHAAAGGNKGDVSISEELVALEGLGWWDVDAGACDSVHDVAPLLLSVLRKSACGVRRQAAGLSLVRLASAAAAAATAATAACPRIAASVVLAASAVVVGATRTGVATSTALSSCVSRPSSPSSPSPELLLVPAGAAAGIAASAALGRFGLGKEKVGLLLQVAEGDTDYYAGKYGAEAARRVIHSCINKS